jgi:hypothetical protein
LISIGNFITKGINIVYALVYFTALRVKKARKAQGLIKHLGKTNAVIFVVASRILMEDKEIIKKSNKVH